MKHNYYYYIFNKLKGMIYGGMYGDILSTNEYSYKTNIYIQIIKETINNDFKYNEQLFKKMYIEILNEEKEKIKIKKIKIKINNEIKILKSKKINKNKINCNSLLRCSIFSLYMLKLIQCENYIKIDCFLTNPNFTCVEYNLIIIWTLNYIFIGFSKLNIIKNIIIKTQNKNIINMLNKILIDNEFKIYSFINDSCLFILYLIFFTLLKFNNYEQSIYFLKKKYMNKKTHYSNFNEIIYLCSQILGAYYGYNNIEKTININNNIYDVDINNICNNTLS
jgi:hypothetical protein